MSRIKEVRGDEIYAQDDAPNPVGSPEHLASMSPEEREEYEQWAEKLEQFQPETSTF